MGLRDGKALLVVNPAAQRGHGAEYGQVALRILRSELGAAELDVVHTSEARHAIAIARDAGAYETVVALGGDGLVHEVVNGLMLIPADDRPALGVVPVGSGNDYARSLGMSFKLERAIGQLLEARARTVDVGSCNGEYFDETLSFGLDAGVALGTEEWRRRLHIAGAPLYLASGVDQMLNHRDAYRFAARLGGGSEADAYGEGGRTLEGEMLLFAVQLGPTYGGGFRICPDAQLDDGLFDLCYANPAGLIKTMLVFVRAKNGGHVGYGEVHFDRASRIRLEFDRRPPVQMDGEPHIADSYDIRIHPRALNVLMGE